MQGLSTVANYLLYSFAGFDSGLLDIVGEGAATGHESDL